VVHGARQGAEVGRAMRALADHGLADEDLERLGE
jgi:hypothetical protein